MRRVMIILFCLTIICAAVSCSNAEPGFLDEGNTDFENILAFYDGKEITLSDRLQIIQNNVNFRKTPGGEVLGRLQGGTVLDCLDERQHKGELWYHARSAEYGEGYVICSFAKPVWDDLDYWPSFDSGNIISDNMLLFAYWMGTYQLDHGLSVIETVGNDQQLNIAPLTVRGDMSVIPEDMKIRLVLKLFEYGFICRNSSYDQLRDESLSFAEKDNIASSVLNRHYGTDDIWKIILGQSVVIWIHENDLHAGNEGPCSGRDLMLTNAVMQKVMLNLNAAVEKDGDTTVKINGVVYYNTKKVIPVKPDESVIVNEELPINGSMTDKKTETQRICSLCLCIYV